MRVLIRRQFGRSLSDELPVKSPLTLGELLKALPAGGRVLDLGCGGGTFRYADFPSVRIQAVDESVHENVSRFPQNAHFVRAGASAIPHPCAVFDLIIVNFAFEHFPDPVAALKEIDRVSRDRAWVWMSMPNARCFEDQLYRNLFAGGGHLQSPTFEGFLRLVYQYTSLKLMSYLELPAGFTFLGESEELRHLTWAIIDALRRSVAIEAQDRSGYIFILQKSSESGPGYREHLRTCHACGTPDGIKSAEKTDRGAPWTCANCGARNVYPSSLNQIRFEEVEKAQRLQWQRLPETRPARLREMVDERGRWGQELEKQLEDLRRQYAALQAECDRLRLRPAEPDRAAAEQGGSSIRPAQSAIECVKNVLRYLSKKAARGRR